MDNFGGALAWDIYTMKQDKELRYMMENTLCGDCRNFLEDGTCYYSGYEVDPNKYASEIGCEEVER